MKTISELVPFLNKEFKECEFIVNEDTIVCKCPKYEQKGEIYWKWDADAADGGMIKLYVETKRSINDRAMALQLVNDYNKGLIMKDSCYDYCSAALTDNNTLLLKNAFLCYDLLTTEDYVSFYYAAMPTLAAMRVLDWWDELAQKAEKGDLTKDDITYNDSDEDSELFERRDEGYSMDPIEQIIVMGDMKKEREEEERKKEEAKRKEEEKKKIEEEKRQEEAKKKAEEEMKREAEEKRPNFFADFLEVAKKTAELEARKKEEEKKEAERQEREAKRKAEEKANENKGLSLLKGLFGKKKSSVDGLSKALSSSDEVGGDTVTATKWKVTKKTITSYPSRMEMIFNAAAEGLGRTLTPQDRKYIFLLANYSIGKFCYCYYIIEGECFDVAVSFTSNEFKNKESAERMIFDIKDYIKLQGIDHCDLSGNKVYIRKDILFRDIEDGDLIAKIQNTTKLLMSAVQTIDGRRKWPLSREATFRKRQQMIAESRFRIEELRSRVADCEADCARHKRDSYYIQKRADAKAALQKEKLRFEKLDSGVDLDEID